MTVLAMQDYRKAVELDPEDAVAHNNLGLLEEKVGYQLKADKRFEKADKLREEQSKEDKMLSKTMDSEITQNEENKAKGNGKKDTKEETNFALNQDSKNETDSNPKTYQSALKKMFSSTEAFGNALKKARDVYFNK